MSGLSEAAACLGEAAAEGPCARLPCGIHRAVTSPLELPALGCLTS